MTALRRSRDKSLVALAALLLLSSSASAEATKDYAPLSVDQPRIPAEETWVWRMTTRGMPIGRLAAGSGKPGKVGGKQVVIIRFAPQLSGLASLIPGIGDITTTWVDLSSGLPIKQRADVKQGKWRNVDFSGGGSFDLVRFKDSKQQKNRRQVLPDGAHPYDFNTLLYAMRSLGQTGARYSTLLYGSTRVWKAYITVGKVETLKTPLGDVRARRIDTRMRRVTLDFGDDNEKPERQLSVWISDDEHRMLALVRARSEHGTVDMSLIEYRRGDTHLVAQN